MHCTTLQASALSKSFGGTTPSTQTVVLSNISIDAHAGELISIVGPSGSGKSTLLYCLSGLETLDAGSVTILGMRVDTASRTEIARLRRDTIGFVFQSLNLVPSLTITENVELPGRIAGKRRSIVPAAAAALHAVGLSEAGRKFPACLSGGEQQRVAVARVLANNPKLVFADEPTGALDSTSGKLVLDLLVDRTRQGTTVVLVTHDMVAASRADRVFLMSDGRIDQVMARATPQQILEATSRPAARAIA